MIKIKPKNKKYIRPVVGLIFIMSGAVFMLIPFIPFGYIFLVGGLFLLAYEIPLLKKVLDKIKAKDRKGRVDKVEQKLKSGEQLVDEKLIEDKEDQVHQ